MELEVSNVFVKNIEAKADIICNEGSSRSGKTFSLLQVLIFKYALRLEWPGVEPLDPHKQYRIDIFRKTRAEHDEAAWEDFFTILTLWEVDDKLYTVNKTKKQVEFKGAKFRFLGIDQAKKRRGPQRDVLFINEATGVSLKDYVQLKIRTSGVIYLDWNPSEKFWAYDKIFENPEIINVDDEHADRDIKLYNQETGTYEKRITYKRIHSTYKDNYDFLTYEQIKAIEDLINIDEWHYKVFALGQLAEPKAKILTNVKYISREEFNSRTKEIGARPFYGVDFGYIHPMAMCECYYENEEGYADIVFFQERKLIDRMIDYILDTQSLKSNYWCDAAGREQITRMQNSGINALRAKKDVRDSSMTLKQIKTIYVPNDIDKRAKDQIDRYKHPEDHNGIINEDQIVKIEDDAPDAIRYAFYNEFRYSW